jgi:hypothetical protein
MHPLNSFWELYPVETYESPIFYPKISILNKKGGKFRKNVGGGRWEKREWEVGEINPPVHLLRHLLQILYLRV